MPPEQLEELGEEASTKSDSYSLTMLLCWLLGKKEKDMRFLENMWIVRFYLPSLNKKIRECLKAYGNKQLIKQVIVVYF